MQLQAQHTTCQQAALSNGNMEARDLSVLYQG